MQSELSSISPSRPTADRLFSPVRGLAVSRAPSSLDRQLVQDLLPRVSRTFALSISLLPEELREAVGVAYLLCRIVDTIEDDPSIGVAPRAALFHGFERLVRHDRVDPSDFAEVGPVVGTTADERQLMGVSDAVFRVFRALPSSQREAIRPWVLEMSAGMRQTISRREPAGSLQLKDLEDLERYCWYVAGTVGELLTELFAVHVGRPELVTTFVDAEPARFGLGLQLVNILKDVGEDAERGVCYLPQDVLRREGLSTEGLLDPAHRPAALRVVDELTDVARAHLRAAMEYTLAWPSGTADEVRLFCVVPLVLAWRTLDVVQNGEDTLVRGRTPKMGRAEVGEVVQRALEVVGDDEDLRAWFKELVEATQAR